MRRSVIAAVLAILLCSPLPSRGQAVVIDPSHAIGMTEFIPSLSLAAVAAGADGLMIEVHNDPAHAKCDGQQSLTPAAFDAMMKKVTSLCNAIR